MRKTIRLCAFAVASTLTLGSAMADSDSRMYTVTVTNITANQTFTPILAATHRAGPALYTLGAPASHELEALAEGGDVMPLKSLLTQDERVTDITDTGALLHPGESVSVTLAGHRKSYLSLAAMLVPTNDNFVGLSSVRLPRKGTVSFYAKAFDAGTEMNDELCASIPGGGGCMGEGNSAASGEGFVHVGNGIHGIGDLPAATYDWNNPVAVVTIEAHH